MLSRAGRGQAPTPACSMAGCAIAEAEIMICSWAVLAVSLAYVAFLFGVAYHGDRLAKRRGRPAAKPVIYALSLAVYCTSWTFYGSVGLAARTGYELPAHLCRPDPAVRRGLAFADPRDSHLQGPQHHLGCRFHRRSLREELGACRRDRGHCRDRHASLHRTSAQSGVDEFRGADAVSGDRNSADRGRSAVLGRHRSRRLNDPGAVRDPVRYAPYRGDRAS